MKIRGMKSFIMMSLITLLVIGLASSGEAAGKDKVYTMNIGYVCPPHVLGGYRGTAYFAQEVFARTNGQVKVVTFVGNNRENVNKVLTGVHQADFNGSHLYTEISEPKYGILDLPFIWSDYDRIEKFRKSELFKPIWHAVDKKGVEMLAMPVYGIMDFQTYKTPANTLEKLRKLKFRISGTNMQIRATKMLGIKSEFPAFQEVYTLLKRHVMDGTIIGSDAFYGNKFYEVLNYYINFPLFNGWLCLVVNKKWIESLPPGYADIIRDAAYKMQEREVHQQRYADISFKALLKQKGMKFIDMAPGEIEKAKELVKPIYEEFANKPGVGKDDFNQVMELIGEEMRIN